MEAEKIIFTMKQAIHQFVMTTFTKLISVVGVQEASKATLAVIDDARRLFLQESSCNWKTFTTEILLGRIEELERIYLKEEDENVKFEISKEHEAIRKLIDDVASIEHREYKDE